MPRGILPRDVDRPRWVLPCGYFAKLSAARVFPRGQPERQDSDTRRKHTGRAHQEGVAGPRHIGSMTYDNAGRNEKAIRKVARSFRGSDRRPGLAKYKPAPCRTYVGQISGDSGQFTLEAPYTPSPPPPRPPQTTHQPAHPPTPHHTHRPAAETTENRISDRPISLGAPRSCCANHR